MPSVRLGGEHLSITADVPEQVARLLRKTKRRIEPRSRVPEGYVLLSDDLPRMNITRRDPAAAVSFLPARRDQDLAPGSEDGPKAATDGAVTLADGVGSVWWYHSIELPGGVVTPGFYDHRPLLPHYPLPESLAGMRVLDVATFDGFWAFEMERRGAEVVATDISRVSELDLPPPACELVAQRGLDRETGEGFRLAHQAIGSRVQRVLCDVYELDPAEIGSFDFVHVSDLLLHLEKPLAALRAMRRVCSGRALIVDCFDPALKGSGVTRYLGGWNGAVWWMPSLDTLGQMVIDAGFRHVEVKVVFALGNAEQPRGLWRAALMASV